MPATMDQRSKIADIERRSETMRLQVEAVRKATAGLEVNRDILPKLYSMATCAVRIEKNIARLAASLKQQPDTAVAGVEAKNHRASTLRPSGCAKSRNWSSSGSLTGNETHPVVVTKLTFVPLPHGLSGRRVALYCAPRASQEVTRLGRRAD